MTSLRFPPEKQPSTMSWVQSLLDWSRRKIGILTTGKSPHSIKSFVLEPSQSTEKSVDSLRVDYVIGLKRRFLIAEVLRLDQELHVQKVLFSSLSDTRAPEKDRLLDQIDAYRRKLDEILDQRLVLNQPVQEPKQQQPVQRRRQDWNQVRAKYESLRREEMWCS